MDEPRHWWRDVVPKDWRVFADRDDISRDKFTAILAALEELSTRGPMSTLSEILTHLRVVGYFDPLTEPELRRALDDLAGDELCTTFRDYAAPLRSYQEMLGRQEGWALTPRGRYVVAAVRSAVVDAHRALQLPTRLLDSVEHTIRRMLTHLADDSGMLPADLDDVRTRIEELQRVTADYYTALAHMVQSDVTDDAVFEDNRDRVIEALRQFPREYERALRRVEAALVELEGAGYRRLVEEAVAHAGLLDARDQQHWIEERVRRLSDLAAWFERDGTVYRLISSASRAVHMLLVAIDRRYAARRRGSDLGADFRSLARSLYRQASDADARRVYAAAYGDWPSWHAQVGPREDDVAHATMAAASVRRRKLDVVLREHQRHGRVGGRPRKVADTTADRAAAFAEAAALAARRQRIGDRLVTAGEVPLGHFAGLDSEAATILFGAVEIALGQLDPASGIGAAHAEGANVLVSVRVETPSTATTVLLAEGCLTGPDLRIQVSSTDFVGGLVADASVADANAEDDTGKLGVA
ncbi:DUF2397 domain-containing protein [Actinoallomurus sp. NBC_01490]|uniref:DUF2397 family protein n=1 Tax=Actinoallomurus sp. NBC_01490 TaxID=2903557 RepID=UPI002E36C450|nr:DUF2397 family protein [Actinoallomurus sp. NBC_01490]